MREGTGHPGSTSGGKNTREGREAGVSDAASQETATRRASRPHLSPWRSDRGVFPAAAFERAFEKAPGRGRVPPHREAPPWPFPVRRRARRTSRKRGGKGEIGISPQARISPFPQPFTRPRSRVPRTG